MNSVFNHVLSQSLLNYSYRKQVSVPLGKDGVKRLTPNGERTLWDYEHFSFIKVVFIWVYAFVKTYQTVYLKCVHLLYTNYTLIKVI